MNGITRAIESIRALEQNAQKNTILHKAHPLGKIIVTFVFIISVVSFSPYNVGGLLVYFIYPFFFMIISETGIGLIWRRILLVLPFAALACAANIITDRDIAFYMGNVGVSFGVLSFVSVIIKAVLTIGSVLLLISTATFTDIAGALCLIKIPNILISVFLLIYRYLDMLMIEALSMSKAYHIRAPGVRGIKMKDMGSFLGGLMLRTVAKGERIYNAMKLRGYSGKLSPSFDKKLKGGDIVFTALICCVFITVRIVAPERILGGIWF